MVPRANAGESYKDYYKRMGMKVPKKGDMLWRGLRIRCTQE